jgi:hypothetical protein
MPLTFENFKQIIDPAILQRGRNYYRSGYIVELEEVGDGRWSAQVGGTYLYEVSIEQAADGELICECTCPYEWGAYCKHVAAVLYAIVEEYPEYATGKKKPAPARKKRQTREEKMRAALDGLSREQLVEVLTELARDDKQLANLLILRYGGTGEDKQTYIRMVRDALSLGQERGFIDYSGAVRAARGVEDLLAQAEALLAEGQALRAVPIAQAVVETVVPALQQADDSTGSLGGCIWAGLDCLQRAAQALAVEESRSLFAYCLQEASHERYAGWDWGWDLVQLAADLISTPDERRKVFDALDRMASRREADGRDDFLSRYDQERAAFIKLSVIEREDGAEAGHAFMKEHVHLLRFREQLVHYCIKHGELAEAKRLCREWLEKRGSEAPGYVSKFLALLLDVARQEKDTAEIVRLAEALFLDTGDFEHYDLLKQSVPTGDWPEFVEGLLRKADQLRHRYYMIPGIYVREQMWERLLAAAQQEGSRLVDGYREYLEPRFPDEVCDIYERIVLKMLERTSNRTTYQEAADYLRRMQGLGQRERAAEIVQTMIAKYGNRWAMIEELNKVGAG